MAAQDIRARPDTADFSDIVSGPVRFRPLILLRSAPPTVWLITALFALMLACWSVLVPQYHAPDEPNHVDAVLRLVQGEGWPHPGNAHVLPGGVGAIAESPYGSREAPYDLSVGPFAEQDAEPREQRPTWEELSEAEQPPGSIQQIVQHPPLYYWTGALVLKALPGGGDGDDFRWDVTIGVLRLMSALMVAPLPLLAWAGAHRLSGGNRFAAASAALVPLAIPQLTHIGSSVNNDNLLVLTGGLATVTIIYVLRGDTSLRTAAWTGTFIGLALFTKSLGIVLVPMAALAYLVAWRRARRDAAAAAGPAASPAMSPPGSSVNGRSAERRGPDDTTPFLLSEAGLVGVPAGATRFPWRQFLLGGVVMVALGGWWWIVNVVRYGTFQPETPGFPLGSRLDGWSAYIEVLVNGTVLRWWGSFGWFEVNLPTLFVRPATAAVIVFCLLALVRGPGWRTRVDLLFLLWPTVGLFGLMTLQSALAFNRHSHVSGISGRYLYGGLAALAIAVGMGTLALGRRFSRVFPLLFFAAAAAAQWWAVKMLFPHYWQPEGGDLADAWDAMLAWSPWPPRSATVALWLLGFFALATLVSCLVMAVRAPGGAPAPPRGAGAVPAGTRPSGAQPPGAGSAGPAAPGLTSDNRTKDNRTKDNRTKDNRTKDERTKDNRTNGTASETARNPRAGHALGNPADEVIETLGPALPAGTAGTGNGSAARGRPLRARRGAHRR